MTEFTHITGDEETLDIILNPDGRLEFKGVSLPEDGCSFFQPVFEWINGYMKYPESKTRLIFNMQYFNTASSKYFLDILENIGELRKEKKEVVVEWIYDEDDSDMEDAGYTLKNLTKLPFIFIPI